jgi:hypothetical protein
MSIPPIANSLTSGVRPKANSVGRCSNRSTRLATPNLSVLGDAILAETESKRLPASMKVQLVQRTGPQIFSQ